jgi:hypothetical protein
MTKTSNKHFKRNALDSISTKDAFQVLRLLYQEDGNIASRIDRIITEYLSGVNFEDVADEVFFALENIEVEEVWDNSGSVRDGYIDPYEYACTLFEETLEPFIKEMNKYQNLRMHSEAKSYCQGILKGIFKFQVESESEYKDWCVDAPKEHFNSILKEWANKQQGSRGIMEIDEFVRTNFPGW